jgi:hypothetical protein
MKTRLSVAFSMAVLGIVALTAPAGAAKGPDFDMVLFGTAAVALGLLVFLSLVYGIKVMTGIEKPLAPPEADTHGGGHH